MKGKHECRDAEVKVDDSTRRDSGPLSDRQPAAATDARGSAHTPGPWLLSGNNRTVGFYRTLRDRESGTEIPQFCAVANVFERTGDTEANAAFIVRACNSHDDLVAAARSAELILDVLDDRLGDAALSRLRAAIAKAEGR